MNTNMQAIAEKKLFTPGPLNTSIRVKEAMLRDLGSRDKEFINKIDEIRTKLLELSGVVKGDYEAVVMQGSGTFGIESVINSTVPIDGKLLVIINGAYGTRIQRIASRLGIDTLELSYQENEIPSLSEIETILSEDEEITSVAIVHCETTTGIINPIHKVGEIVKKYNAEYIVDAMSSFGAYKIDLVDDKIDYLISSSNKCIEGVPGFSFVLAKLASLEKKESFSISTSLDLFEQWKGLEKNGQFRFTPPTHSLLAFNEALNELDEEGGITGRANRYIKNHELLISGMYELDFETYVPLEYQGHIITAFYYPNHANFDFNTFYEELSIRGFVIYPGKLSKVDCFRIGNIGKIYENDISELLGAISEVKIKMNF